MPCVFPKPSDSKPGPRKLGDIRSQPTVKISMKPTSPCHRYDVGALPGNQKYVPATQSVHGGFPGPPESLVPNFTSVLGGSIVWTGELVQQKQQRQRQQQQQQQQQEQEQQQQQEHEQRQQ